MRIDAENCDVLNERATFDLQKIKDEHIGYHLHEQMLADENVNLVKLSCYDKSFSPAKAYRVTLIDYDAATVRAKLNVQGYIDVFIDPENAEITMLIPLFLSLDLSILIKISEIRQSIRN